MSNNYDDHGAMDAAKDAEIAALKEELEHAESAEEAWCNVAQRVGEDLATVGPDGYYEFSADEWREWCLNQITALRAAKEDAERSIEQQKKDHESIFHQMEYTLNQHIEAAERERNALAQQVERLRAVNFDAERVLAWSGSHHAYCPQFIRDEENPVCNCGFEGLGDRMQKAREALTPTPAPVDHSVESTEMVPTQNAGDRESVIEECAKVADSDDYTMFLTTEDVLTPGMIERDRRVRKQMRREVAAKIRALLRPAKPGSTS